MLKTLSLSLLLPHLPLAVGLMDEIFPKLDDEQQFVVLLVFILCVTGLIIAIVAMALKLSASIHRRQSDANLKREMLERGMSAEEITQVIEATPREKREI